MDPKAAAGHLKELASKNITVFCEFYGIVKAANDVMGYKLLREPYMVVLSLVSMVTFVMGLLQVILKPLGQFTFIAQMLAGIAVGPSALARSESFAMAYSDKVNMVLNLFEAVGLVFFIFILSLRIDLSILRKTGRLAIIIGAGSFLLPNAVTVAIAFLLKNMASLNHGLRSSLLAVATVQSTTSFHVVLAVLTDLKLLNSELGRLALSSSLISGMCSWIGFLIIIGIKDVPADEVFKNATLYKNLSLIALAIIIVFAYRPTSFWIMRKTPEGKSLKQTHVVLIGFMVLSSALFGEITGLHYFVGPTIFGVAIPSTPPLGASVIEKIGNFVWAVFMPCCLINLGKEVDFFSIRLGEFLVVLLLIFVSSSAKFCAAMIPSLYCKMPPIDALSLGLILNSRGIFDIIVFAKAKQVELITNDSLAVMVIMALLKYSIISLVITNVYDSSRRYVAYKRRTIQHKGRESELLVLTCIHEPDDVAAIINLLEASNPPASSLAVYALNLEELVGRTMPLLVAHQLEKSETSKPSKVDPMLKAFHHYQQQNRGLVQVQCFTAIGPYATMHDDVCAMAFEKSTTLIILHLQKTNAHFIKNVVKNVIDMAPCSVGILYDRGLFVDPRPIFSYRSSLNVCSIFIGGSDDREALAYGARMAEHHSIMFAVIRFVSKIQKSSDLNEKDQDLNSLNQFRFSSVDSKNIEYIEHSVNDGSETARMIHSFGNNYDLILAGRRQKTDSPVLVGLSEWSEIEELGVIGDLLASTDFKSRASVLIVQQQASVVEDMIETHPKPSSYHLPK